ncbi:30S ribosomal protein S5 [bacterium]|nr:30S ribosomal protein S5 [bacterium]MBU1615001.1 30S ribosomal protein S5 [bacterium]
MRQERQEAVKALKEEVIFINRVAKVVKGGRRFSFSALVVVGDEKGSMGLGFGKANEVAASIKKGTEVARKNVKEFSLDGNTFSHEVMGSFGKSKVLIKPARPGTGIIAGGTVRLIMEACGVQDVLTKCYGSRTPINVSRAVLNGLEKIKELEDRVKLRKGKFKDEPA